MLIKTVISAQATGGEIILSEDNKEAVLQISGDGNEDYILNTAKEYINNIDF